MILFISEQYLPRIGSSEISAHTLLRKLKKDGYDCSVLTFIHPKRPEKIDNIKIYEIIHPSNIKKMLKKIKPSIIFTQLAWAKYAIEYGKMQKIPVFFFTRVNDINNSADVIVFNSKYTQNKYSYISKESILLEPMIISKEVINNKKDDSMQKWITFINPSLKKGAEIVYKLIKNNPDKNFLIIKKSTTQNIPKFPFENVKILEPVQYNQIKFIYEKTKITLVPSLWEDPSPRVCIESIVNEIPVLGSDIGGIPDYVPKELLVKKINNICCWKEKITDTLENYQFYKQKIKKVKIKYYKRINKEYKLFKRKIKEFF